MNTHTPTPWKLDLSAESGEADWKIQILSSENRPAIAYAWGSDRKEVEANAAFVVRAVNAYQTMLDALKACEESEWINPDGTTAPIIRGDLRQVVEQAIAIAEGR